MRLSILAALVIVLSQGVPSRAEDKDGYRPMFNGKDLTGWVNVNCAPSTFFVRGEEIITTGHPTGFLRTAKQYENFIAEFDWMHVNKKAVGNSGFFVWADPLPAVGTGYTRGIEVQVLVNLEKEGYYTSQGDLFSIWGATCKPDRPHPHGWERCLPSENRTKGGGEWNHYMVIGNNGVLKLHVNGKEVSGISQCRPRKGYLALESEGAECHFKNLKIKEMPSTNPTPAETADVDQGFKNLYTGLDLSGWRVEDGPMIADTPPGAGPIAKTPAKKHWQPRDWVLHYDGKGGALRTEKAYGDAEFIFDFRFLKKDSKPCKFIVHGGMAQGMEVSLATDGTMSLTTKEGRLPPAGKFAELQPIGQWNRLQFRITKDEFEITYAQSKQRSTSKIHANAAWPRTGALVLQPEDTMEFGNLFVRELKK